MTQGERIKEVRNTLDLTLEKFGERLGVTKVAISNIEKGNRKLTEQMAKSISREFDVDYTWLLTGEGDMFNIPDDEVAAIVSEVLENPDTEFYQLVLSFMKTYAALSDSSRAIIDDFICEAIRNRQNGLKPPTFPIN